MSLMLSCPNCGTEYETGLDGERELCRECKRVESRLASGGRGLSGSERVAMAELFGAVVPAKGLPFEVEETVGGLVMGNGSLVDMKTLDGERAVVIDPRRFEGDAYD